jgi:GNAT superfamily N-acetyltransferase
MDRQVREPEGVALHEGGGIEPEALVSLYAAVGWSAYTRDPEGLTRAVRESTYVLSAWTGEMLIGLARGLSDEVSIFYLQDILVHPAWQRRGIGRILLTRCLERYAHVRQKVLLTDDEAGAHAFYQALGFENVRALGLSAYVQLEPVNK